MYGKLDTCFDMNRTNSGQHPEKYDDFVKNKTNSGRCSEKYDDVVKNRMTSWNIVKNRTNSGWRPEKYNDVVKKRTNSGWRREKYATTSWKIGQRPEKYVVRYQGALDPIQVSFNSDLPFVWKVSWYQRWLFNQCRLR